VPGPGRRAAEVADLRIRFYIKIVRELPQEKRESYAGSLLVAHPNMLDPNFRRAVLFISAHTADDGALGVILNRPLEKQVSEVVSETPLNALEKVPVFFWRTSGSRSFNFCFAGVEDRGRTQTESQCGC